MTIDSRTPVLVGVGAVQQKCDDPLEAAEPIELMARALECAAEDAGSRDLLAAAGSIRVPRGFWDYPDPGRRLAQRFGAVRAKTLLAEIGVLQTTLLGGAIEAIAAGDEEVVLIAGGEAKYRALRAHISGIALPAAIEDDSVPDITLHPAQEIWSAREEELGLLMPVNQYSIMENALRHAEGLSVEAHRREIAEVWADFSRVAVDNPAAWDRNRHSAAEIYGGGGNRMLAFPYTKLHNSQWNVDQAAGLILCSVRAAEAAGIARERWVFPLAVAESNHMLPLSQRAQLHRSPGFRIAGATALDRAQRSIEDIRHFELYSCFPIAVRVQQRELQVPQGRVLTVTGGMAFAGGPLNNFVLQALVRMVERLRVDRGSTGLVTAVSGMLTKQGVSVWSTDAPRDPARAVDVTDAVARDTGVVEVVEADDGTARCVSYTVVYEGGRPARAVLLGDRSDGRRVLVGVDDPGQAAAIAEQEPCGRRVAELARISH